MEPYGGRIERIARRVVAFKEYRNPPQEWGSSGGMIFPAKHVIAYPFDNKWAVFVYHPDDFQLSEANRKKWQDLVEHRLEHSERRVKIDFISIRQRYKEFQSKEEMVEFLKRVMNIDFDTSIWFENEGMKVCNLSHGKMDDDAIRRVMHRGLVRIWKAIGRDVAAKYYPEKVFFEPRDMNEASVAGVNVPAGNCIVVSSDSKYDVQIDIFVHEFTHQILDRNPAVKKTIMEKFAKYTGRHMDKISFSKGDLITVDMGDGKTTTFRAADDFRPSNDPGHMPSRDVGVFYVSGYRPLMPVFRYRDICSRRIIKIERPDGTVIENDLKMSQYAFMNPEEFIATLIEYYCNGRLPKKMEVFAKEQVIPFL